MKAKEFEALRIGDTVRVRDYEDLKQDYGLDKLGNIDCPRGFTKGMKQYCGKEYEVAEINREWRIVRFADNRYAFHASVIETPEKRQKDGYIEYTIDMLNNGKDRGACEIGEPTTLVDYDGKPLYTGDIVAVESEIGDGKRIRIMTTVMRDRTMAARAKDDSGAFIMGFAEWHNEKAQDHDKAKVIKTISFEDVGDGTELPFVRIRRDL